MHTSKPHLKISIQTLLLYILLFSHLASVTPHGSPPPTTHFLPTPLSSPFANLTPRQPDDQWRLYLRTSSLVIPTRAALPFFLEFWATLADLAHEYEQANEDPVHTFSVEEEPAHMRFWSEEPIPWECLRVFAQRMMELTARGLVDGRLDAMMRSAQGQVVRCYLGIVGG
ncbi:MAG: hypothetical protein HETSPECPRED_004805 [Heterodermia speciosa]|uniref:Uncharacterized protein n=1 Tax=Heterodermia speciosa TaxID=116794 RepID=A0A8H3I2K4_9LECA|nr:MAG: hypothetical protein HETSPECPRED_004805 [Heterodermia speciosa]